MGLANRVMLSWLGHSLVQKPQGDRANVSPPECEPSSLGSRQDGPPFCFMVPLKEVGYREIVKTPKVTLYLLSLL